MRAACRTNILSSMHSAKNLHAFDTHTMRAACPTNFIIYSLSRTLYMHLTPTLCMLHAHLISYHICILPEIPHAFETHTMRAAGDTNILISIISFQHTRRIGTHTMRAACPTNILSSMPSA